MGRTDGSSKKGRRSRLRVIHDRPMFRKEIRLDGKVVWTGRRIPAKLIQQALKHDPTAHVTVTWHRIQGTLL